MNTAEFLDYLKSLNIKLSVQKNNLKCVASPHVITPILKTQIAQRKQELLTFLQEFQAITTNNFPIQTLKTNQDNLCLSFSQQRLWFLHQFKSLNSAYTIFRIYQLEGNLNLLALERSLQTIVERHEILRSNFCNENGLPSLKIKDNVVVKIELEDYQNDEIQNLIVKEIKQPFNLSKDNLFRLRIFKINHQKYIFAIAIHHIISDGWSMRIFNRELSLLYQAYNNNQKPNLLSLPIQYKDFTIWQRKCLPENLLNKKIASWQNDLGEIPLLSTFPPDYPRPKISTFKGIKLQQIINNPLKNQLKNFSQKEGVTLFIILLTALKVLLYRHTGQKKLIIGFPIAARNHLQIENLIGFFVNTSLVSSNLTDNITFRQLLDQVKESVLKAYQDQDLPFEKLVEKIQPTREINHNPLFQIWFNMLNLESQPLTLDEIKVKNLSQSHTNISSKFDLNIYIQESENSLQLNWVYNRDLYKAETINWLAKQYQTLLSEIVIHPEEKINRISLLKSHQIKHSLNIQNLFNPDNSFVNFLLSEIEQSISQRFEKQVKLYPHKVAIKSKNNQLSYQQLNQKINHIVAAILSLSSSKIEQIALLFEHDIDMIASLLAVLKIGKIYIPCDTNYPIERLNFILEDSQANLLLTNSKNYDLASKLTQKTIKIINIDQLVPTSNNSIDNPNLSLNPESIAYIIYTSGTTGKPKGVIQTHRNILHFIRNYTNNLYICNEDRVSLLASINFDAAVMDIFGALLNGATLCLYDLKLNGLNQLSQWLEEEKITIYHSTPTVYRYLLSEISTTIKESQIIDNKNYTAEIIKQKVKLNHQLFPHLRLIVLGGEEVFLTDIKAYQNYFNDNCILINNYGPTESTVTMQSFFNKDIKVNQKFIPIGYPIEKTEIQLLDKEGNDAQIYGEIAIKSEYLAKGYWQQPELTAKVFLNNLDNNQRIYRTGDWGRLRSDGSIEFLGRKDFQVKIRGMRIELSEIEANLRQNLKIKDCVVITNKNQQENDYLIAYIITQNEQPIETKSLEEFLQTKLPQYMIPNVFIFLDSFPLTSSRKIDRRALSTNYIDTNSNQKFIAPRNEIEAKLTQIWQKVLGIDNISINDNFFTLGGHSLLATQITARIQNTFRQSLPLRYLFEFPTIKQISDRIKNSDTDFV